MQPNSTFEIGRTRTIVFALVLFIALPVCYGVYAKRSNAYTAKPVAAATGTKTNVDFSNGEVLRDWIPANAYTQTVNAINAYFARTGTSITDMTIADSKINTTNGSYIFSIQIKPQNDSHAVAVQINNFDGTLSTLVIIDGKAQSTQATNTPTTTNPPTNNLSDLVTAAGITNVQVSELLQGFAKFAPKAGNITAETSGVQTTGLNQGTANQITVIHFIVTIDKTNYLAQAQLTDLSSIRLLLSDAKTSKQIFDSGILNGTQ